MNEKPSRAPLTSGSSGRRDPTATHRGTICGRRRSTQKLAGATRRLTFVQANTARYARGGHPLVGRSTRRVARPPRGAAQLAPRYVSP